MAEDRQAFILSLPDELLGPILLNAAHVTQPSRFENRVFGTAVALSRVCQRFYSLVTPQLYADIWIRCTDGDQDGAARQTRLLHRTFRQNASLWPYCRKLTIDSGNYFHVPASRRQSPMCNLLYVVVDFMSWLTGTTHLYIQDDGLDLSEILRMLSLAVDHLPCLQELKLHHIYGAPFVLPELVSALSGLGPSACLRTLDLQGISNIGSSLDWERLRAMAGTASFTELNLSNFVQTLETLEALTRWPVNLEGFSFRLPSEYPYAGEHSLSTYTLGKLQPILAAQKATLTHVRIRELYSMGLEEFNVTDFPKLRSLSLSHGLTGTDTTYVGNLVAPNLREFHWDMTLEDQQLGETLGNFAQPEEDWLRALSAAAIDRKSALHHIRIQFSPEAFIYSHERKTIHDKYPWDRMDQIGREVQPHGITISYNIPTVTKEEFREMLEAPPDNFVHTDPFSITGSA